MNNLEILNALNEIDEKFLSEVESGEILDNANENNHYILFYAKRIATVCAIIILIFFGSVQANKETIKEKLFDSEHIEFVPKEISDDVEIINAYFPLTENQSNDKLYLKYKVNNEEKEIELVRSDKNEE